MSFDATRSAASVEAILASATATDAAATVSTEGSACGSVDEFPGAVEQRARRVDPDLQFAGDRDRIGIVTRPVDACIFAGPSGVANELNRVGERRLGDALLDRGVHDLCERAHRGRTLEQRGERQNGERMHLHIVEQRRARAGGPLTEAAPIVDDRDPFRVPRHEGDRADIVLVIGDDRDPMGEQHAGRIELAAVEAIDGAIAREAGRVVVRSLGAGFRERVAEPLARQHASVEEALLLLCPLQTQALEHEEVVLRDLADRAVGARERGDHTRDGSRTHAGPAISLRHSDGEQARIGEEVHLLVREDAVAIAGGGAFRKFRGNLLGDRKRLRVVADSSRRPRAQGRRAKLSDVVFDCRELRRSCEACLRQQGDVSSRRGAGARRR